MTSVSRERSSCAIARIGFTLTCCADEAENNEPARRTKVSTFHGSSFVAERGEDGDLHVYHVGTSMLPSDTVGDARPAKERVRDHKPMTAAALQERSLRLRATGR